MAEENEGNWYDPFVTAGSTAWDWLSDSNNTQGIGALFGAAGTALDWFEKDQKQAGYQGKIPDYTAVREQLPRTNYNQGNLTGSSRMPGGGGQRYFTDTYYGQTPNNLKGIGSLENAQAAANAQKMALSTQNLERFPARKRNVNSAAWKEALEKKMFADALAKQGYNAEMPNPPHNVNSAAWKEALEKKMFADALAKQGYNAEMPNVFTGGSQTFDESKPPEGGWAYPGTIYDAPDSYYDALVKQGYNAEMPNVFTGGSQTFDESKPPHNVNSAAWKEALEKKMFADALAERGRNAEMPNVFTGGSQTFDESNGQYMEIPEIVYDNRGDDRLAPEPWEPTMSCFLAGTKIAMSDGTEKDIENVVVGDTVKAFNIDTGEVIDSLVPTVFVHPNTNGYYIINNNINVTGNHPMRVDDEWKDVDNLKVGDKLHHLDGSKVNVETIDKIEDTVTTYNFEVKTVHNYFANKHLVHNKTLPMSNSEYNRLYPNGLNSNSRNAPIPYDNRGDAPIAPEPPLRNEAGMAQGGIVNALPQAYLNGPSDGMADQVPAMIDNQRPASLSHGEMVIPADVVSHMGNGNSDAGAKQFYDMMDRVRNARTGNKQQGKQINPNKFMPR